MGAEITLVSAGQALILELGGYPRTQRLAIRAWLAAFSSRFLEGALGFSVGIESLGQNRDGLTLRLPSAALDGKVTPGIPVPRQ